MDSRELERMIQYLFNTFKLEQYKENNIEEPSFYKGEMQRCINYVLSLLTVEEQMFIQKEFLGSNKFWWQEYYSRSTYYRIKKDCMNKFINLINRI